MSKCPHGRTIIEFFDGDSIRIHCSECGEFWKGAIEHPDTPEWVRRAVPNRGDITERLRGHRGTAHENETQAAAEIERLRGDMETAWVIIANAYGGDWDQASKASGWKKAAERWRDEAWHRIAVASCAEMYQPLPVDPR